MVVEVAVKAVVAKVGVGKEREKAILGLLPRNRKKRKVGDNLLL